MTDDRRKRGRAIAETLFGADITLPLDDLDDPFVAITVDHLFGDVWTRPGLAVRDRSLATCAMLAALGKEAELRLHVNGALNVGISAEALEELMIHVAHYAGWPAGLNAIRTVREIAQARSQDKG